MAFKMSKREPVDFGGEVYMPKIDAELKMRIASLSFKTIDDLDEAYSVFGEAFPGHEKDVAKFLRENAGAYGLIELQTYLTQGDEGLDMLHSRVDKFVDKQVDAAISEMGAING